MPKNSKKEKIKEAIAKDEATLVAIAKEFGVKQPYISQLKKEVDSEINLELLKFMYDIMNTKMSWKERPISKVIDKIKEVRDRI
ncbi:MAG: hypothetical protein GY870_12515 [archaeon]|nr:hypothetical protein [archaeon]